MVFFFSALDLLNTKMALYVYSMIKLSGNQRAESLGGLPN